MNNKVNTRTEQAFQKYQLEFAELFATLHVRFPGMGDTLTDFAKAAFFAGANYENAYLNGLHHLNERKTA